MRKIVVLSLLLIGTNLGLCQGVLMQDGVINQLCDTNFYDSGGIGTSGTSRYSNNEHFTLTFFPEAGKYIRFDFSYFDVDPSDLLTFYDGADNTANILGAYNNSNYNGGIIMATASNTSGALTIEFISNGSARRGGWKAKLDCVYQCQTVIADAQYSEIDQNSIIKICQGVNVQMNGTANYPNNNQYYLQEDVTSNFKWKIVHPDGSLEAREGSMQNVLFSSEGIYETWLFVEDTNKCLNTNVEKMLFFVSTTPSFSNYVIQNDTICLGEQNVLEILPTAVSAIQNCAPPIGDTLYLPDGDGTFYETTINVSCYAHGLTIQNASDLEICLNMEHSYLGDLTIEIFCPNGSKAVILEHSLTDNCLGEFLGVPDGNDNLVPGVGWDYCFSNQGTINLDQQAGITQSNVSIPAGLYLPFESFNSLIGCDLNGGWKIKITDELEEDNGFIFSWGVNFSSSIPVNPSNSFTPILNVEEWLDNGTIMQNNGNQIVVLPTNPGLNCYPFSVTDDFGCVYDTTLCFYVKVGTTIPTIQDFTFCDGQEFQSIALDNGISWINMNPSIGLPGSGTGSIGSFTTQTFNGQSNSSQIMLVRPNNECGQGDTIEFSIDVNPLPNATVTVNPQVCQYDTAFFNILDFTNNYTYDWSMPLVDNLENQSIVISADMNVSLTVTNSQTTCSTSQSFSISTLPIPFIDAGADLSSCPNQNIILSASGANSYEWNNGVIASSISVSPSQTTTYSVIGQGANGCIASDEITINIFDSNFAPLSDIEICEGDSTILNVTNLTNIIWSNGINNNEYFQPGLGVQFYVLSAQDQSGCVVADTVFVTVNSNPNANLTFENGNYYVGSSIEFFNLSSNANSFVWELNNEQINENSMNSVLHSSASSGNLWVKLTAFNGVCSDDTIIKLIILNYPPAEFNLPNIFTPNEDSKNNLFYLNVRYVKELNIQIFNRWGNLMKEINGIYDPSNPDTFWDGLTNGKTVTEGVYFYKAELVGVDGNTYKGSSSLQIIKQ